LRNQTYSQLQKLRENKVECGCSLMVVALCQMGSQAWVLRFRMGLHVADDGRGENMTQKLFLGKFQVEIKAGPFQITVTSSDPLQLLVIAKQIILLLKGQMGIKPKMKMMP